MRRADLHHTQRNEQSGLRPVLVVNHDVFHDRPETVIAIALTSQPQKAGFPLAMLCPCSDTAGLP
ncbi:type II toxin-antitoxin system PemK/MazF family toxin [Chlorobium limicola]